MGFLKNKHLIVAMIIAPLLAVIAYFAVDHAVSEKPHAAVDGGTYKLIAKSNCRYKSGLCTLENGDVEIQLRVEIIDGKRAEIALSANMPVQNALISIVDESTNEESEDPQPMMASAERQGYLIATIDRVPTEESFIRLVLKVSDTLYYAQTTAVFVEYETSFSRENFSN